MTFPLKPLCFYKVKIDFKTDKNWQGDNFLKGQCLQYLKTDSNIHDMMEVVHFKEIKSKQNLSWTTRVENLYGNRNQYLEEIPNPLIAKRESVA